MTAAELPAELKHALSHRARDRALTAQLRTGALVAPAERRDATEPDAAAAAVAVRALPLVRAQMPVLRLQLTRAAGRAAARASISRRCCAIWTQQAPQARRAERCRACSSAVALRACSAPRRSARLLEGVRARARSSRSDAEITLEANPGTVERGRFADYRAAGITRVSLGAQSFSPAQLRAPRAAFTAPSETRRAAAELHAAGLSNFNLDLMYALPQQSAEAGAGRHRGCARARAGACVALSADARARHAYSRARPPARLPDADRCRRDAAGLPAAAGRGGLCASTRCRPMRAGPRAAATTSTTGTSATISASAPVPTASAARWLEGGADRVERRASRGASRARYGCASATELTRPRGRDSRRAAVRVPA